MRAIIALTIVAAVVPNAIALDVYEYDAELHDRFTNDDDFIGNSYDWSGISRAEYSSTSFTQWATMISDTHFLTVNHNNPATGTNLNFYSTNDPNGDIWTGTVQGGSQIGDADLWIGQVLNESEEAPPSWVKRYPLIKRQEGINYLAIEETIKDLFVVGKTGGTQTATSMRFGTNEIDGITPDEIRALYDSGIANESKVQGGDSGGPTFAITQAGPTLVGVHRGIPAGDMFDTSISAWLPDILDYMNNTANESVVVATDQPGDINGSFGVTGADYLIMQNHWNQGPGMTYADGDLNGNGYVTGADYLIFQNHNSESIYIDIDVNNDDVINDLEFDVIGQNWLQSGSFADGDLNGDGSIDLDDIEILDTFWPTHLGYAGPSEAVVGDVTGNGIVDSGDLFVIITNWGTEVDPYTNGDLTGNGFVDGADYLIFQNNEYPYAPGDFDQSGTVDLVDLDILAGNWHETVSSIKHGDANEDGFVDEDDFSILGDWWRYGYGSISTPPNPIPEPASALLAGLAALGLAAFVRR